MNHRYHLWLVGALVLSSASIAEARKWKGGNDGNTYPTLLSCFQAKNPTCTPQGRAIRISNVSAIPNETVQTARLARGVSPPEEPVYFIPVSEGRRPTKSGSGGIRIEETRACWTIGTNNFSLRPCGASQIEVEVIE